MLLYSNPSCSPHVTSTLRLDFNLTASLDLWNSVRGALGQHRWGLACFLFSLLLRRHAKKSFSISCDQFTWNYPWYLEPALTVLPTIYAFFLPCFLTYCLFFLSLHAVNLRTKILLQILTGSNCSSVLFYLFCCEGKINVVPSLYLQTPSDQRLAVGKSAEMWASCLF